MEKELQRKIAWFENRHAEQAKKVQVIENDRKLDRSSTAHKQLKEAKKEKLRLKDHIEWLKKLANQLPKN
jgi:hypothetical protein